MNLRLGRFKGRIAMTADIFYAWPHAPKPWGISVAWSDGSASFVELSKYDYEVSVRKNYNSTDKYVYFFWRALETGDFKDFSKKVDANQWSALRIQYPPL
jgi:hypothetical protein